MRAPNADHLVEVLAKANFDAYSKDAGGVMGGELLRSLLIDGVM